MMRNCSTWVLLVTLALSSNTPAETAGNELDFFIGDWEIQTRYILQDRSYAEGKATAKSRKILDGTAMIDEWRSLDDAGQVVFRGVTFRTYLPVKKRWQIMWLLANSEGHTEIEARFVDGTLLMSGKGRDPNGEFLERARYFDISENHYSFTMDRSYDGGKTWITPFSEFVATRSK